MNRRRCTVAAAVAVLACAACSGEGSLPDDRGGGDPQRIVVLAPAAAEMLSALGLLDRVVGVGEFGPWPGALASAPVIGGYASPNVERVLELRADLLITAASETAHPAHRTLERFGVRVLALDTSTYAGVFRSLEEVGRLFDMESAAREIGQRMRAELDRIAEQAEGLPRRRVLFVVGRDPLYVAGPGSHIDEMIELVGGENVTHDALTPYAQASLETILERLPQVIVDTSDNSADALRGRTPGPWSRWGFLPAVRDNRVFWVEPGRLVIPGLRLPEMTRLMARIVHPESFGDPMAQTSAGSTDDAGP